MLAALGQQVEVENCRTGLRDALAQRGRRSVDQAAFHTAGGDHAFTRLAPAFKFDGHALQGLACVAAAEVFAPADIKTAVRRPQRRNVHTPRSQKRRPGTVGTQLRPTGAAQRQYRGAGAGQRFTGRALKAQRAIVSPTQPAVALVKDHALRTQPVQPGPQQRRGLQVGGEHTA